MRWIGDWLAYGERAYGEMYSQAIEETGRTYADLSLMATVSERVPVSNRFETLSWSHHYAIASLDPSEQSRWLGKAETEGWSTRELREQLRLATRPGAVADCSELRCLIHDGVLPSDRKVLLPSDLPSPRLASVPMRCRTLSVQESIAAH